MTIIIDGRTIQDHFPGIARYTCHLARALARVAPDLDLSLLHDPSAVSTRLTLPDLPRIACPVSPFSIRQQWSVPRLLHRAGATLYHSPYYLMPYLPGVPTVFTCHDLIPLIYPEYFSPLQRLIYRLTHALALQTASRAIAVSQATKANLLRYFRVDARRIVVIPEAADTHFCSQPADSIAAMRHKYALPERYVLYFGSNKPHKNLVTLVKAWQMANLKSQTPTLRVTPGQSTPLGNPRGMGHGASVSNLKLVIAGQWDERYPEARRLAEELGLKDQVVFAGPVSEADLPALYSGAMLFVFPSLYEGFGLPVLEAMACGTPVVCSNTSSLPEVAGNAALLVEPQDVTALADALSRAANDEELRQAMRKKGLTQATQFSWERTARETLTVYRSLM